jgi:hypothetical protein
MAIAHHEEFDGHHKRLCKFFYLLVIPLFIPRIANLFHSTIDLRRPASCRRTQTRSPKGSSFYRITTCKNRPKNGLRQLLQQCGNTKVLVSDWACSG